jgi:hypothetical protein
MTELVIIFFIFQVIRLVLVLIFSVQALLTIVFFFLVRVVASLTPSGRELRLSFLSFGLIV